MAKLRKNVVVSGQLLYDHVFVLDLLLDALDDRDLIALTGLPAWVVHSFRYNAYHLDDNLFADGKHRPSNFHQNV